MKQCDRNTIEYYGIPSAVLMERAALAVFAEVSRRIEKNAGRILIVCGSGNNGGDGLAAARLFYLAGYDVEVWMPADKKKMTAETKAQYETACRYEIPVIMGPQPDSAYAVVVDALFGIGLSRMIEGQLAACIDIMNRIDAYKQLQSILHRVFQRIPETSGIRRFVQTLRLRLVLPRSASFCIRAHRIPGSLFLPISALMRKVCAV